MLSPTLRTPRRMGHPPRGSAIKQRPPIPPGWLGHPAGESEIKRPGVPAGAPNRISGLRVYKKIIAITAESLDPRQRVKHLSESRARPPYLKRFRSPEWKGTNLGINSVVSHPEPHRGWGIHLLVVRSKDHPILRIGLGTRRTRLAGSKLESQS